MTILAIKTAVANYFGLTVADLTVNGQDLALLALNQVRRQAELLHDFEFQRKLVTVSVNGVTGGSLENGVLKSDGVTSVNVKTVVDIGQFDENDNLRPVEWTTVAESLERQRGENRFGGLTYESTDLGEQTSLSRFTLSSDGIFRVPKVTDVTYVLGLEVYAFSSDWTREADIAVMSGATGGSAGYFNGNWTPATGFLGYGADRAFFRQYVTSMYFLWSNGVSWFVTTADFVGYTTATNRFELTVPASAGSPAGTYTAYGAGGFAGIPVVTFSETNATTDTWTTYASDYLIWATIVQLNHRFQKFVFRQEGALPPPEKLRDAALQSFIDWDASRYENNRRHRR